MRKGSWHKTGVYGGGVDNCWVVSVASVSLTRSDEMLMDPDAAAEAGSESLTV